MALAEACLKSMMCNSSNVLQAWWIMKQTFMVCCIRRYRTISMGHVKLNIDISHRLAMRPAVYEIPIYRENQIQIDPTMNINQHEAVKLQNNYV